MFGAMCATDGSPTTSLPRAADGPAVDPIRLEPVDELLEGGNVIGIGRFGAGKG